MAENINALNQYVDNENEEENVAFFKARYESVEKELSVFITFSTETLSQDAQIFFIIL